MKSNSIPFWYVYSFLNRQVNQIANGGFRALYRKCYILLTLLIIYLFIPLVLFIRVLRPLALIRFGMIESDRIGHLSRMTELYLCKKELGTRDRTLDIFCYRRPVSNKQLLKMYGRILCISRFYEILYKSNRMLIGYKTHEVALRESRGIDVSNLTARTKPHISFTQEEENRGWDALYDIGLPDGTSFILFHARDSEYLAKNLTYKSRDQWAYHEYRDFNIHNYCAAVESLTQRGYYAFRMGAIVNDALDTTNPKVIDYAVKHRTDFLDIYLLSKCKFFIGSYNGITNTAYDLFRKPIACVNFVPLEFIWMWYPNALYIPKKYWLRNARRFMTFREIFESGAGKYSYAQEYERHGIELVENTPEEINVLAMEMDDRLNGTWQTTDEDETLQKQFWNIFPKSEFRGEIRARIGTEFLRDNRELLD